MTIMLANLHNSHSKIKRQYFGIQKLKTIKGERKLEQNNLHLPYFNWCVQVFRLEAYNSACLHPFLFLFP
jgi:hypothetical protein